MFLLMVVALMLYGSVERLFRPETIHYPQALLVAGLGLGVNLVSAWILGGARPASHGHGHGHSHAHGQDLNLQSAYLHVVADAATSVAAIVALAGGWWFGWSWLDPLMGIAGAVLVALWAKGLLADTAKVLLDREMDHPVVEEIRDLIAERGADSETAIADLHVWRVGKATYSCALSLVTHDAALTPARVREWLSVHEEIVHSTIEIQRCPAA